MELNSLFSRDEHFSTSPSSRSQTRFIQTNKDLQLTVTEEVQLEEEDEFNWKFKNENNIARVFHSKQLIFDDYKDRVEFFPEDLSLVLKNVTPSDSGIYTAVLSGNTDVTHAKYDVRVQDPVSPVLLSLDSVFNSPESCNFNASCTTELSPSISRSFTCDRRTCEEASPAPSDPASSLHLYLSDMLIICNHSNHVSRTEDTKEIREVCSLLGTARIGLIVGVIVLFLGFLCFTVVLWKRLWRRRIIRENTVDLW
uniref:Immunoglobulin V-set domain-containing protein n=1 Tax=Neogobius melanostomus TaxID=47308 RepID=A0A8C6SVN3_9GOBI